MPELRFETMRNPPAALQEFLWAQLQSYGLSRLNQPELKDTAFLGTTVHHGNEIVAGALAYVFFKGYNLQLLWVREDFRRQQLGRRLLEDAETQARELGCTVLFGFSFGFQAPGFYLKAGYEVFGTIKDYPKGYDCFFLNKRL